MSASSSVLVSHGQRSGGTSPHVSAALLVRCSETSRPHLHDETTASIRSRHAGAITDAR